MVQSCAIHFCEGGKNETISEIRDGVYGLVGNLFGMRNQQEGGKHKHGKCE